MLNECQYIKVLLPKNSGWPQVPTCIVEKHQQDTFSHVALVTLVMAPQQATFIFRGRQ